MAEIDPNESVGIIAEQFVTLYSPPNELVLDSGQKLGPVCLAL